MQNVWRVSLLTGVMVFGLMGSVGCQSEEVETSTTKIGEPMEAGEKLFEGHCAQCHAIGNPAMGMDQLTARSAKFTDAKTLEAFLRQPDAMGMPPFSEKQLPTQDVNALYEYLAKSYR